MCSYCSIQPQERLENVAFTLGNCMPQLKIKEYLERRSEYWQTIDSLCQKEFIKELENINIETNQEIAMQLFWYIWYI
jgi:hypothetical protein